MEVMIHSVTSYAYIHDVRCLVHLDWMLELATVLI